MEALEPLLPRNVLKDRGGRAADGGAIAIAERGGESNRKHVVGEPYHVFSTRRPNAVDRRARERPGDGWRSAGDALEHGSPDQFTEWQPEQRAGSRIGEQQRTMRVHGHDATADVAQDVIRLQPDEYELGGRALPRFLQPRADVAAGQGDGTEDDELQPHAEIGRGAAQPQDLDEVADDTEERDEQPAADGQQQRRARDDEDIEEGKLGCASPRDVDDRGHQQQVEYALPVQERPAQPRGAVSGTIDLGVGRRSHRDHHRDREDQRRDSRVGRGRAGPDELRGEEDGRRDGEATQIHPPDHPPGVEHGLLQPPPLHRRGRTCRRARREGRCGRGQKGRAVGHYGLSS